MLGHPPQFSGVSTQVLAECTPALAGEGRKNQSLLVPNVLERAEERRSTLEGVSESRTGRGETEASGSPHRLAKGKQRSTPAWTWVRRATARALNDHIAGAVSTASTSVNLVPALGGLPKY